MMKIVSTIVHGFCSLAFVPKLVLCDHYLLSLRSSYMGSLIVLFHNILNMNVPVVYSRECLPYYTEKNKPNYSIESRTLYYRQWSCKKANLYKELFLKLHYPEKHTFFWFSIFFFYFGIISSVFLSVLICQIFPLSTPLSLVRNFRNFFILLTIVSFTHSAMLVNWVFLIAFFISQSHYFFSCWLVYPRTSFPRHTPSPHTLLR